jgi:hypothetical protein
MGGGSSDGRDGAEGGLEEGGVLVEEFGCGERVEVLVGAEADVVGGGGVEVGF